MAGPKNIQYITDATGKKQSVILSIETYEKMLEDIQDLVAIVERKEGKTVPMEDVTENLKADGLL